MPHLDGHLAACASITLALGAAGCSTPQKKIDSYISAVRADPTRATDALPPTCTNGEQGKRAIIDAFEAAQEDEEVGGLRLATFLSLACYRTSQVRDAIGSGLGSDIYKAQVPLDEEAIDVMIRAWASEDDPERREAMEYAYMDLDHATSHELYKRLREQDLLPLDNDMLPRGLRLTIEGASPEEVEAIREDWCARVAGVELARFDALPDDTSSSTARANVIGGLFANRCDEADAVLAKMVSTADLGVRAREDELRAGGMDPATVVSTVEPDLGLKWLQQGYPLISDVSWAILREAKLDAKIAWRFLKVVDEQVPSCAMVKLIATSMSNLDDEERAARDEVFVPWQKPHLKRCQLERWPE